MKPIAVAVFIAGIIGLSTFATARAHVPWFTPHEDFPISLDAVLAWPTVLGLGAAAIVVAGAWLISRAALPKLDALLRPETLGISGVQLVRLTQWLPLFLAAHVVFPLLALTIQLQLLAPHLELPWNLWGALIALGQLAAGLMLIYGAFSRFAAVGLALLVLAVVPFFGPLHALEQLHFLGIAAYFYIVGRGTFSLDRLLGRPSSPIANLQPYAVPALRILAGLGLVWAGFTEKLWNLPLAEAFLEEYPMNLLAATGFDVTNAQFALIIGTIEVAAGFLLVSGFLTRAAVLVVWFPLNLTLPLLGYVELIGHLPWYGIMAILLIYGGRSHPLGTAGRDSDRPRTVDRTGVRARSGR
ncbi:MAG: hypothetical protein WD533_08030 [Dehalococcoidia bacterium]